MKKIYMAPASKTQVFNCTQTILTASDVSIQDVTDGTDFELGVREQEMHIFQDAEW